MRRSVASWMFRGASLLGFSGIVAVMMASGAHAAPATPATISIADDKVSAHVSGPTARSATVHLVMSNDSASTANVTFGATFGDGTSATVTPSHVKVKAHQVTPVALKLSKYSFREVSGHLTATVGGGATSTVPFTITRSPSETAIFWTLVIAAGIGAAFALVVTILTGGKAWQGTALGAAPKWSFTESWAQNIGGLGAILGTVLGASGFVGSELEGLDTAKFLGLILLAGGLILIAPLLMLGGPTRVGFLLASTTTLLAAFLEIVTLMALLRYAHASTGAGWFLSCLIIAAGALLFAYGVITATSTIDGTRAHHATTGRRRVTAIPAGGNRADPPAAELSIPLI